MAKTVYFDLSFPVGEGVDRTASFMAEFDSSWGWTIIHSYWADTEEPLADELVGASINRIEDAAMEALYDY